MEGDPESINRNLVQAKIKADKEAEIKAEENRKKREEEKARLIEEQGEIDGVKSFLEELGGSILENQIAEWRNPNEEDRGENYFVLVRNTANVLGVKLWSDNIGFAVMPITVDEIKTAPLARMISSRFKWIRDNDIKPIIYSTLSN